jgi:hypothetical protein
MPVQTRAQTLNLLQKKVAENDKLLQALKDVLFFQTANGRELEAFQDLVNWLADNHLELEKLIKDNFSQEPGFHFKDSTNFPSLEPYLMKAIDDETISDYRVFVVLYNFRPTPSKQGDMASKSEYGYLIKWLNKNIFQLLNLNNETMRLNFSLRQSYSYDERINMIKFWLENKIKTGRISAFRYDYNPSNIEYRID